MSAAAAAVATAPATFPTPAPAPAADYSQSDVNQHLTLNLEPRATQSSLQKTQPNLRPVETAKPAEAAKSAKSLFQGSGMRFPPTDLAPPGTPSTWARKRYNIGWTGCSAAVTCAVGKHIIVIAADMTDQIVPALWMTTWVSDHDKTLSMTEEEWWARIDPRLRPEHLRYIKYPFPNVPKEVIAVKAGKN